MAESSSEPDRGPTEPPTYDLSYRDAFWASRAYEDLCDRIALRALLPTSGGQLLDLGAGFGRLSDEYAAFGHVTLVDASPAMIQAALERVGGDPRFTVIQAEATDIPMPSGSVDVVVAVRLILHVRNPEAVFAEVARVLRPGGLFILEFPNRNHLLARVRHLARRQEWAPGDPESHEYRAGHFSHQPATIAGQLRGAGLVPVRRRAVSLFRLGRLKRLIPARYLARLESPLQAPLGRLAPSPSVYIASRNRSRHALAAATALAEQPSAAVAPAVVVEPEAPSAAG
jgi:SAM-dependent methyltransferase